VCVCVHACTCLCTRAHVRVVMIFASLLCGVSLSLVFPSVPLHLAHFAQNAGLRVDVWAFFSCPSLIYVCDIWMCDTTIQSHTVCSKSGHSFWYHDPSVSFPCVTGFIDVCDVCDVCDVSRNVTHEKNPTKYPPHRISRMNRVNNEHLVRRVRRLLQCVAVCCSVLHFDAVCCSMVQCITACCSVLQ